MAWYRAVLRCDDLPSAAGPKAAQNITANFAKRNWHSSAVCNWNGTSLTLVVENDFDRDGRATLDEFSDEISACVSDGFDGDLRVLSVTEIAH
jgi:hypothetical protein